MNSKRLSTASLKAVEDDRINLNLDIEKLLAAPSNYEVGSDGKRIDKSSGKIVQDTSSKGVTLVDETGEIIKTFDSGSLCAQYLGIGRTSVYSKIKSNRPVLFNNKKYYIKLINSVAEFALRCAALRCPALPRDPLVLNSLISYN